MEDADLDSLGVEAAVRRTRPESHGANDDQDTEIVVQECERFYRGASMLGTFRQSDRLLVQRTHLAVVRVGDVVLFRRTRPNGTREEIVHRVVALRPGGLITRGDNRDVIDQEPVTEENLVGRVTHVDRKGRTRRLAGGRHGMLRVALRRRLQRVRRCTGRLLASIARWPYSWLRDSGLARRLWRPKITRLVVAGIRGPVVKYIVRGRAVAKWSPVRNRFWCRTPYQLLIQFPGEEGEDST